jgi:6-phosphogluconolactonase
LVSSEFAESIEWNRIDFFFGDERDVSPMSERNNYRMANELLFKPLGLPQTQIYRWHTEIIEVSEVALHYEKAIRKYFDLKIGEFPSFDLVLMGLGDDGHTASLFPFTDALEVDDRIAVSNRVEKFDSFRLTLTIPAFNNASNIYFMVTGENKAAALLEVLEGQENSAKYPAQLIKPKSGNVTWFIGESAAGKLSKKAKSKR